MKKNKFQRLRLTGAMMIVLSLSMILLSCPEPGGDDPKPTTEPPVEATIEPTEAPTPDDTIEPSPEPTDIPQEVCDGIDNDFDGVIDEEGAIGCTTYYMDSDGDTYGTSATLCLCSAAYPYTATRSGDCNDSSASIRPGGSESCSDSIDSDCDGSTNDGAVVNNNPSPSSYIDLGGVVGDEMTTCTHVTLSGSQRNGTGERWYKIRITETAVIAGIRMWAFLQTPSGMDYELYLYRDGTESANMVDSSTGSAGALEVVMGRVEDQLLVTDDHDYYIEIRYYNGPDSCSQWTLDVWAGCTTQPQ